MEKLVYIPKVEPFVLDQVICNAIGRVMFWTSQLSKKSDLANVRSKLNKKNKSKLTVTRGDVTKCLELEECKNLHKEYVVFKVIEV